MLVRKEFRDVLYAHPEAGGYSASDFDEMFSAAFAQTLAFGLLLVREATGSPVGVLSQDELVEDIGIAHEWTPAPAWQR